MEDPREGTAVVGGDPLLPGCMDPDGGTALDTSVLVKADSRFHASDGTVTAVPQNLMGQDVEILIPRGLGFDRRVGTVVAGGLKFENVPHTEFYVRSGTSYFLTRERRFDLSVNRVGRADAVYPPPTGVPAQVNLQGLAPWQDYESISSKGSYFEFATGDVDVYGSLAGSVTPTTGDTSYVDPGAFFTNSTGYPMPALSATRGDRLYVNQLSVLTAGTTPSSGAALTYSTITRSLRMPAFDYTPDGVSPLTLQGTLLEVPLTSVSLEWRLAEFTRWRKDVSPTAVPTYPSLQIMPVANGVQDGWVGYMGLLLDLYLPRGEDGVLTRRLSYGNPYPSTWGVVGTATYAFRAPTPTVVGIRSHFPSGLTYVTDHLDPLVAAPIQPSVSPPRELRIDGVDAYVSRQVGATQPVLTWRPPAMGTPQVYIVTVNQLMADLSPNPITRFFLPGNRTVFRLPPGFLQPGSTYFVRVTADASPHYEPWRAPNLSRELLPIQHSDTYSATFTTP
ncbi:hypothetical protein D7V80_27545 [Corallococcus sp. CA054B]|nr:hypothetical protein D7V80_27545 [Corallococcus sp. CA054B]